MAQTEWMKQRYLETILSEINQGEPIKTYTINAKDYGLALAENETLIGGSPKENKNYNKYFKRK